MLVDQPPLKARSERRNWTEMTWSSFWPTDQWVNSNALSNNVGGLRGYAYVRVNQWPLGSPCLPIGQFLKNTVSVQFSYDALYAPLGYTHALTRITSGANSCRDTTRAVLPVASLQTATKLNELSISKL